MPRRERATIMGEILGALSRASSDGDTRLTRIASACNLPYDRFQEYLQDLQQRGLVDPKNPLQLTPEGRRVLGTYRQWKESLRLFGMSPDE